jgi:hypothetical protein
MENRGLLFIPDISGFTRFVSETESRWQVGVQKVEDIDHHLPRIGMRCHVFTDSGDTYIYSSSYYYTPEKIRFSETEEKSDDTTYFTLEKINDTTTRLTIDIYHRKNLITQFLPFLAGKNELQSNYRKSLLNLEQLLVEFPGSAGA